VIGNTACPAPLPDWKTLYERALLEVDLSILPKRIEEAKRAISQRLPDVQKKGHWQEYTAIMDALYVLADLTRMNEPQDRAA
jgi:hypothetical protein